MTTHSNLPAVLITGASSGIGAIYADRFARRGHDVVLVARNESRLNALAERLRPEYGVAVGIQRADLTKPADLSQVEHRLRTDTSIGVLVNNAGSSAPGEFTTLETEQVTNLIALNVTAPTRLTAAIAPRLIANRSGAVVIVSSMVSLMPDYGKFVFGTFEQNQAIYGATKAYSLYLSQSLHAELEPHGVYVEAVVPAGTLTGVFSSTGRDPDSLSGLMPAEDFVDAALVGFDRREAVTMPSLPDENRWNEYDAARQALVATVGQERPAARYLEEIK